MKKTISDILKGFLIGSSMSVPGVSGGTMAILLGIYDKLISSISNFFHDIKGNFLFLFKICAGGMLGLLLLARLITTLLDAFPIPVSFFFLGAVIGGIPALYQKTKESRFKYSSFFYFALGLIIVISIGFIPTGKLTLGSGSGISQILMLLVTGIVIAIALVLPGISTSHMLLILGMYDSMLLAITEFDVVYIGVLGTATLVGIILITKPLEWVMKKYHHKTYCMIIGFVLGSTNEIVKAKILPALPSDLELTWCLGTGALSIITFALGVMGILYLSRFSNE